MTTKESLVAALYRFAEQRPGLEYANYGDVSAYRAESRRITRDRQDAEELLRAVERSSAVNADHILANATNRLTFDVSNPKDVRIDYCVGQYFPTEYRPAVCRVLAGALWDAWMEFTPGCPEDGTRGDTVRRIARNVLSRRVAVKYFD